MRKQKNSLNCQIQGRYFIDLTLVLGKLVHLEQAQRMCYIQGIGVSVCNLAIMIFSLNYQYSTQGLSCTGHCSR